MEEREGMPPSVFISVQYNLREYEGIMHCGCSHSNPHILFLQESQQSGLTCTQANSGIKDTTATLDCISAVTLSLRRMFSQLKLKKGPDRPCSLQASKLKLLVLYRTPYTMFFKEYTLSQKYRRKEWVIIARGLSVLWEHKLTPTLMFISSDNRSFTLSFGLLLGNWHTDGESFHHLYAWTLFTSEQYECWIPIKSRNSKESSYV